MLLQPWGGDCIVSDYGVEIIETKPEEEMNRLFKYYSEVEKLIDLGPSTSKVETKLLELRISLNISYVDHINAV